MRIALTLFLTIFSLQAAGQTFFPWMEKAYKQENPNELAYFLLVHPDCPVTEEEGESILEGVLVRSRIKPLVRPAWVSRPLYLSVSLECIKPKNNNPVFQIIARFGDVSGEIPIFYFPDYGFFGIGPKDSMKTAFQGRVEAAITDYLKANFDLGD